MRSNSNALALELDAPAIFKMSSAAIFALGAMIHSGRMIVGLEPWQQHVFTPPVDIAFGLLATLPAVTGAMAWRHYCGGRGLKLAYGFAMFMVIISVPLHLKTIFTWSTEYLLAFPFWYSAVEVPMFIGLSCAMTRLQFDRR